MSIGSTPATVVLWFCVLGGLSSVSTSGQAVPSELRSDDPRTRMRAFADWSTELRTRTQTQRPFDEAARAALLQLLRTENELIVELSNAGTGASVKFGEGYGEYYAQLLQHARTSFEWVAPSERAEWLRVLAESTYNGDSPFASWLAGFGDESVEVFLPLRHSGATAAKRANAYVALTAMFAGTSFRPLHPPDSVPPLSFQNRQRVLAAVREGLNADDLGVSREIIWTLRRNPSDEGVNVLREFQAGARGRPGFTTFRLGQNGQTLSEVVDEAIRTMEARLRGRR